MMKIAIFQFIFFIGIIIPIQSLACSCAAQPDDIYEAVTSSYNDADMVVLAAAESVEVSESYVETTQFRVIRSWKGNNISVFSTRISTACCLCGISFKQDETYLLYLNGPNKIGSYHTTTCTRNANLDDAAPDIEILDQLFPNSNK